MGFESAALRGFSYLLYSKYDFLTFHRLICSEMLCPELDTNMRNVFVCDI